MLRKAFQQLRNVEIDWDLQLHIVHVRSLTQSEPEISLCCCFCRVGEGSARHTGVAVIPSCGWTAAPCGSAPSASTD